MNLQPAQKGKSATFFAPKETNSPCRGFYGFSYPNQMECWIRLFTLLAVEFVYFVVVV
jgi:hypothetical protein